MPSTTTRWALALGSAACLALAGIAAAPAANAATVDYECTTVVSATDLSPGLIALLRSLGVDPDSLGTGDTVGVGCQPTAGSPAAPINITDGTRTFDCSNITVDLLTVTVLRGCDAV